MVELERVTADGAERALLGALMIEGDRVMPIAAGVAGLTPDAFSVPANRKVAEVVWRLIGTANKFVDVITVSAELERLDQLDELGGLDFLLAIIESCPATAHAAYYCQLVRDKWLLRRALNVTATIQQEIHVGPENAEEFVRRVPDRFLGIVGQESGAELSNVEVMESNYQKWSDALDFRNGDMSKKPAIGIATPFAMMTEMVAGLEPGITIIGGRPSAGKTTMEDMLSIHAASLGVKVGRISLDSTRASLLGRAQCRLAGVSMAKLKHGFARRNQLEGIREATEQLAKLPFWIRTDLADIASIRMWALERKRMDGLGMLTVDYVQQVQASELGRNQDNAYARMTHVIAKLKKLALDELEIPVIVLSQLSRGSAGTGSPGMSDLRDSGALEQDADKVMLLSVDDKKRKEMEEADPNATKHKRPVLCDVVKHKDGETGRLPLWMFPPYFTFEVSASGWDDDVLPGDLEEIGREFAALPHLVPLDEGLE